MHQRAISDIDHILQYPLFICIASTLITNCDNFLIGMGCFCSSDYVPDVPKVIKADPDSNPVTVQIAAYGMFGGSRDFGIWLNQRPSSGSEQTETVWLWFNKSDVGGGQVRLDLENFMRGHNPDQPKKGRVLYYVLMPELPHFQHFQRIASSGIDSFFGFFGHNSYQDNEDSFYINHAQHSSKLHNGLQSMVLGHVIAKWQMNTRAQLLDGEMGRAEEALQGKPLDVEVFAKGTVIRSYVVTDVVVNDVDAEGNQVGSHIEKHYSHETTELVDRIEYRVMFQNKLWTQFFVEGDTFANFNVDPTIDCNLFTTTLVGGWFKRTVFTTSTKQGVDPALAMLLSHLCASEYSVMQVKRDLRLPLPDYYPGGMGLLGGGLNGLTMNIQYTQPVGEFSWTM